MNTTHLRTAALALGFASLTASAAPPTYRILHLHAPTHQTSCGIDALNDVGQVVFTCVSDPGRIYLYQKGVGQRQIELGVTHYGSSVVAINNTGTIAGSVDADGTWQPFVWDATSGTRLLGQLAPDSTTRVNDMNEAGQVIGSGDFNPRTYVGHGFLWSEDTGMVRPRALQPNYSDPVGINDKGQVAVNARHWDGASGGMVTEAMLWRVSDKLTPLGGLPTTDGSFLSMAYGINDQGQVAGVSSIRQDLAHAFVWTPQTGMKDIDGRIDAGSSARAINNRGQVVGTMWPADARGNSAFYWDSSTGLVNLYDLIDPADPLRESLKLSNGYKINNRGEIALWATIEGVSAIVLLTPVRP